MRSPKDTGRGVRVGRLLATATATCVLATGFLAAPVAGLPWNDGRLQTLAADQHTPDVGAGSPVGEGVSVGVVGTPTSTGPTTLQEVLGVLERAELASQDAGRRVTPAVDQAAAELGMLLSTYLAQQAARSSDRPFAAADVETPSPVLPAPATEPDATEPDATEPEAVAVARQVAIDPADEPSPLATGEQPDAAQPDAAQPDGKPADESAHDGDEVTFDDLVVAATRLATLLDPATTTLEAGILPAGADGTVAARATLTASLLEVVDRYGRSTAGYANGRIPTSALCPLDFAPGHMLRCDAAEQLSALSKEYEKEFGVPIPMTDSYRSLELQIRVKATKGWLAATPGTSNHGWGLAVDLGYPISTFTSAEHAWMRVHAPDYGWDNPSWARLTGSKPEPWHFEFFAAGPVPDRAWESDDVATGGGPSPAERADKGAASGKGSKAGSTGGSKDAKDTSKDRSKDKDKAADEPGKSSGTDPKGSGKGKGSDDGEGSGKGDGGSGSGSETPAKVSVPNLAGETLATAEKKLKALGLKVTTKEKPDPKAPEGTVVETRGAGTKVSKGSTVTLVVSSGPPAPATVKVPDVTGWTVADARAKLKGLGFVVALDPADGVEDGDLVVATKGAGSAVPKGSTVVLSWGDAESVPDVAGKSVADARAELEALGFDVSTDPVEGVGDDDVVAKTVGAGTVVLTGSTVTLVVTVDGSSKDPDAEDTEESADATDAG
ncbi:PASTA domain-containing protein [Isoptericola sp. NPDC056578]|uniref:M15 family metallopeptidase n=1 Tax=Isoptericola sp. NPDC056578 TaxID=3345870 RepID=UPI0036BFE80E